MRKPIRTLMTIVLAMAMITGACGDDDATPETVVVTSIVEVEVPGDTVVVTETSIVTETVTETEIVPTELNVEELLIGTTVVLSGPASYVGETVVPPIDLAIEDINARGGIVVGDTRYILRHVVYDDQYNADSATANVQRMIAQGVTFINTWGTVATVAAQPITEAAGVVTFNGASGLTAVNADMPLTFRIAGASGTLANMTYEAIVASYPEIQTVAIINANDDSGQGSSEAAIAAAEANGLTVVADEYFERGTADYYPTLQKMLDGGPDLIDISSSPQHGQIVKQARELGFEGLFIGPLANVGADIEIAGAEAMEGYFGYMAMDRNSTLNTPEQNDLWDRFEAKYPDRLALVYLFEYYDAIMGLAEAIEVAQSLDGPAVAEAWANLVWTGVSGEDIYFTGTDTFGIQRQVSHIPQFGIVTDGVVVETNRIRYEVP